MDTGPKVLKSMKLFENLKIEELARVAALMQPMSVKEGEVLTRRGQPARTFFVILSGNFMIWGKDGEAFTLHEPGGVIGWSILQSRLTYSRTAVALTDGKVLAMPGVEFVRLLKSDIHLGDKILKAVNTQRPAWSRRYA